MQRIRVDLLDGALFDDLAGIHDDHPRTELPDDPHVVGDQQHRGLLALHLQNQVEDLGLNGDVERGGRFVGDNQLRLEHERHGNHDALSHATGELMGIGTHPLGRVANAHLAQPLLGHLMGRAVADAVVQLDCFDQLSSDTVEWREGRHRFLEDHADRPPADGAHLANG